MLPTLTDLLADAHVVSLPMRVRFRGITTREVVLIEGPAGWGEFGAFPEYDDAEAAQWLRSAIESAWEGPPPALRNSIPVNATVPALDAAQVAGVLARFPGATTAKVKVAEPGQTLDDDLQRVAAVRELIPNVRVDANGGWTLDEATRALEALTRDAPLEYAEQPCASVDDLVELRRRLPQIRIAADESIRRADDPMRVVRAGGLDVAVVKVAPLGGMRPLLAIGDQLGAHGIPLVVSSALDSAVGMNAGLAAAAALPELELACGLGTGGFFVRDVAAPRELVAGSLDVEPVVPDMTAVRELAALPEREQWWRDRVRRCYRLLAEN
ncbi:o-succinylbenzoate synthase [Antrihabitans cavernicola]|uniref:o-succinylbenzoate synthase n=1 Tax=Antrihabitans cavernicola TaxID=2495913 RepID=UPI0025B72604|nr:o-succinylbenzoate synthase [Spelaeibacter cavernicola]